MSANGHVNKCSIHPLSDTLRDSAVRMEFVFLPVFTVYKSKNSFAPELLKLDYEKSTGKINITNIYIVFFQNLNKL